MCLHLFEKQKNPFLDENYNGLMVGYRCRILQLLFWQIFCLFVVLFMDWLILMIILVFTFAVLAVSWRLIWIRSISTD